MRHFRPFLIALALSACMDKPSDKSDDDTHTDTETDTEETDTDTQVDTDTDVDTDVDTDTQVDTDTDGDETADTSPIDSFIPPGDTNGPGDTGVTPPNPTGVPTPDTGDSSLGGGTGTPGDTDPCPPSEILDCDGLCYPRVLLGDGTCHIGGFGNPDFDCPQLARDDGDCATGETAQPPAACDGPLDVLDCNDDCSIITFVGDGFCDDGTNGGPDFDCPLYQADGGDCAAP